jgi:hypothetical protein
MLLFYLGVPYFDPIKGGDNNDPIIPKNYNAFQYPNVYYLSSRIIKELAHRFICTFGACYLEKSGDTKRVISETSSRSASPNAVG